MDSILDIHPGQILLLIHRMCLTADFDHQKLVSDYVANRALSINKYWQHGESGKSEALFAGDSASIQDPKARGGVTPLAQGQLQLAAIERDVFRKKYTA